MTGEPIPITPEVLRWAREWARFSIEEMLKGFPKIESWERGESFPTYPQIELLAAKYKVPVAVFFFPEPPDVPPIGESFRTLPDAEFDTLPREVHFLLRKATALQISLVELNDGRNPAERFILRDLRFSHDIDIPAMARQVREYLGVPLEVQTAWEGNEAAFEAWREALETRGVAVFKDAFKNDSYSGFCLYDQEFLLIYVNNSVKTRQIFTLFHGLAHLLFHTSGIDRPDHDPDEDPLSSDRRIEVMCNGFAAEFLLPETRFLAETRGLPPTEETAARLARRYHVSRESVFRRFLDRGDITREEYERAAMNWASQSRPSSGGGGDFCWTKIAYLGRRYIDLAFSRYYQNRISESELADHLDVKVKHLDDLENHYLSKAV